MALPFPRPSWPPEFLPQTKSLPSSVQESQAQTLVEINNTIITVHTCAAQSNLVKKYIRGGNHISFMLYLSQTSVKCYYRDLEYFIKKRLRVMHCMMQCSIQWQLTTTLNNSITFTEHHEQMTIKYVILGVIAQI